MPNTPPPAPRGLVVTKSYAGGNRNGFGGVGIGIGDGDEGWDEIDTGSQFFFAERRERERERPRVWLVLEECMMECGVDCERGIERERGGFGDMKR